MDPDVEDLVRQERLIEGARLASARGDAKRASVLFERACDWRSAAMEALRSCDAARALGLAVRAGNDALAGQAAAQLAADPLAAGAAAAVMAEQGSESWAALLFEAAGRPTEAARAWQRAGDARRAAELFERAGELAPAARALEAALQRDPADFGAATVLGGLLARFGRAEAAVRVLQRVPGHAPERRAALSFLIELFGQLDLPVAARETSAELVRLGGTPRPEPRPVSVPSRLLWGRYEVVREVASSATAQVLECIDRVRGERVAVKRLAAWGVQGTGRDALARAEREARALGAVDHPSVVPFRDFVSEGPAFVFAWMAGGTLGDVLREGPIAPARAAEIAVSVLSALGDAHRLGIVHRGVKPENVLFDGSGAARLSDFGASHFADSSATAGIYGTRGYMSPEQRRGRPATPLGDVFAVGVMLCQMLTGQPLDLEGDRRRRPSELDPGLDHRHDEIIALMTADDPLRRPSAFEARAWIGTLRWPARVRPPGPTLEASPRSTAEASADRLDLRTDGSAFDTWAQRPVERVPLTDSCLDRARRFALANHPSLQVILRIDHDSLWLESPRGGPLRRPLESTERARLREALEALHAAGCQHGSVVTSCVSVDDRGGVVLCFAPQPNAAASTSNDFDGLARL